MTGSRGALQALPGGVEKMAGLRAEVEGHPVAFADGGVARRLRHQLAAVRQARMHIGARSQVFEGLNLAFHFAARIEGHVLGANAQREPAAGGDARSQGGNRERGAVEERHRAPLLPGLLHATSRKFIFGAPMKPATNRLAGFDTAPAATPPAPHGPRSAP
jgi:hypothetical protein